jgi:hypothetical protein
MVQAAGDHWLTTSELDRPALVEALTGLLWGEFAGLSGSDKEETSSVDSAGRAADA